MEDRVPDSSGSDRRSARRSSRLGRLALAGAAAITLASFAAALVPASSTAGAADPTGVILVSWDGARYDVLQELTHWQPLTETPRLCPGNDFTPARMPEACGEYWSCLPTICTFEIVESHTVPGKTLTRVQHATMLTGNTPEQTSISTNNGSSSVPVGMTVYERLHAVFGDDIQFAHVGSHRYTVRGILRWVQNTLIPEGRVRTRGRPDRFTGTGSNDNFLPLLADFDGKPFFAFLHQKGIDMAGHGVGDRSLQYRVAMIATDQRLKEMLEELERLGMADRTHVFVTTDHGFWHNQHLGGVRPVIGRTWFAAQKDSLLCYKRANVLDVVPTILASFGIDPSTSLPAMPGSSLLDPTRESVCVPPVCGNGVVEAGEDCEPDVTLADTCESLAYQRGELACGSKCTYDTADCADLPGESRLIMMPSFFGGVDLQVKLFDRERGGPDFDPAIDAVSVQLLNGENVLWQGGTENYDDSWRIHNDVKAWGKARGSRQDGLIGVRLSSPVRRLKAQIKAGSVGGIRDYLDIANLRTVIRVGRERFDTDLACHVAQDKILVCTYETPPAARAELHRERDREAPRP